MRASKRPEQIHTTNKVSTSVRMHVCVFIVIEFKGKETHVLHLVICLWLLLVNCSFVFEALREMAKLYTHYERLN